jgi:O-antigen ligase
MSPLPLILFLILGMLVALIIGLPFTIRLSEYLLEGGEKGYVLIPLLLALVAAFYVLYLVARNQRRRLLLFFLVTFPLISTLHRRISISVLGTEFFLETFLVLLLGFYFWNRKRIKNHQLTSINVFMIFSVVGVFLSCLFNKVTTFNTGWYAIQEYLLPFILFFIALSVVKNRNDLNMIIKALLYSVIFYAILSVIWIFVLNRTIGIDIMQLLTIQTRINGGMRRLLVGAGFVNSETGNRVFLLVAPLSIMLINNREFRVSNVINYLVIFMTIYFVIATEHRAGILGGIILFVLYILFSKTKNVRAWFKLIVLAVVLYLLQDKIVDYLGRRMILDDSFMMDTSAQKRIIMWNFALGLFKGNPIFGIGPLQYLPTAMNTPAQAITPHNYYITLMAEVGLVGLFGYLGLVGTLFVKGWRNTRQLLDPAFRRLNFGIMAGIFYYQFVLFFGGGRLTHNNSIYIHSLFWLVASLLWLLPYVEREERAAAQVRVSATDPPSAGRDPSEPLVAELGDAAPRDPGP